MPALRGRRRAGSVTPIATLRRVRHRRCARRCAPPAAPSGARQTVGLLLRPPPPTMRCSPPGIDWCSRRRRSGCRSSTRPDGRPVSRRHRTLAGGQRIPDVPLYMRRAHDRRPGRLMKLQTARMFARPGFSGLPGRRRPGGGQELRQDGFAVVHAADVPRRGPVPSVRQRRAHQVGAGCAVRRARGGRCLTCHSPPVCIHDLRQLRCWPPSIRSTAPPCRLQFPQRPTLLGALLVTPQAGGAAPRRGGGVRRHGGSRHPASHAHRGRTARNGTMFGPRATCTFTVPTASTCARMSSADRMGWRAGAASRGRGDRGEDLVRARRGPRARGELATGPGRLGQALGLTPDDDGIDLFDRNSPFVCWRTGAIGSPAVHGRHHPGTDVALALLGSRQ